MGTYIITDNNDDVMWSPSSGIVLPGIHWLVTVNNEPSSFVALRFTNIPDTLPVSLTLKVTPQATTFTGFEVYGVVRNGAQPTTIDIINKFVLTEEPVATFLGGAPGNVPIEVPLTITDDLSSMWRGSTTRELVFVLKPTFGNVQLYGAGSDYPFTLSTVEASINTGLTGARYVIDWERMRGTGGMVCPKTGQIMARTEAVRDGYTGMLVHPDAYDPPEPKEPPRRVREEDWSWEG